MAIFVCSDCNSNVSSSAMDCVHCGNVLQVNRPGVIGSLIRIFYAIFCVATVVIGMGAFADASKSARPFDAILVPLVIFGIWFAGSVSLAVLFYVTRHGRIVRVQGAVLPTGEEKLKAVPKASGWARQTS